MTAAEHSPLPWSFSEVRFDEIIRDANGNVVHLDTAYYPSGLATADARLIVAAVNAIHEIANGRVDEGGNLRNHPDATAIARTALGLPAGR